MPALSLPALSDAMAEAVTAAARSVVAVRARARGTSSGVLWHPDVVVTAEEILEQDEDLRVTLPDGSSTEASLAGRDHTTDIAVLRLATEATVTERPKAAGNVSPGTLALAIGRAGTDPIAAFGIVAQASGAWRSSTGGLVDARIRLNMELSPRAEGGALIAADGGLIGMAVFGPRRGVIAIPTLTIERVVPKLLAEGRVATGYLGLGMQTVRISPEGAVKDGAIVLSVDQDGPSAAAGVLQGDIIVGFGGEPVRGVPGLLNHLDPDRIGQDAKLDLIRAGQPVSVTVKIGERPNP